MNIPFPAYKEAMSICIEALERAPVIEMPYIDICLPKSLETAYIANAEITDWDIDMRPNMEKRFPDT